MQIDTAIRQKMCDPYSEASSSFQFCPVTTTDGIDALEENLNNESFAKQLFAQMKRIIGHTGDACNGLNIAYGLIDHFFDRKLMLFCSWTGESRGDSVKYPMRKCVNILDIFFKLIRSVNSTFSRTLLEDFFKRITRNSKKRSESKGKRQSTIHRRAKTKKENKGSNSDFDCALGLSSVSATPNLLPVDQDKPETSGVHVDENEDYETNSEHEEENSLEDSDDD
ncbi:uncharacterized protein LOC110677976 isoform X4 [Aedes aegypti]|nr:uncharacterized protein LOC110677976 isoform X4 [Aedes aegypti]